MILQEKKKQSVNQPGGAGRQSRQAEQAEQAGRPADITAHAAAPP